MRLGLGSFALAWNVGVPGYPVQRPLDVFGFADLAAQHGFELVQIADNLPLTGMSEAELRRLERHLQTLGLGVELGTREIWGRNLERHLELCERLGSTLLRVVVDGPDHHPSPNEVVETVKAVLPKFEAAGIILALENHDRFTSRTLAGIVTALDSPLVGICLDTVNSFGALEGPEVVVRTLGPFVVNLHVKDFVVRRMNHNMGFTVTGTPAGQGILSLPELLNKLAAFGRDPNLVLELWPAPEKTLAATLEKERRWVGESARYLKTLFAVRSER